MATGANSSNSLLNLGVNAGHAMPGGGQLVTGTSAFDRLAIYLIAHSQPAPGEHVVLTVSDTGSGMAAR